MMNRSSRRLVCVTAIAACLLAPREARAAGAETYRTPPTAVVGIITAKRTAATTANLSPDRQWLLVSESEPLTTVADLARPVAMLGGLEIAPAQNVRRRDALFGSLSLTLVRIADGLTRPIRLPEGTRAAGMLWSPDSKWIAFQAIGNSGARVALASVETGETRLIASAPLNATLGPAVRWAADGRALLCLFVPDGRGALPQEPDVPDAPIVEHSAGYAAPQRTHRSLLRTVNDERRFEYYTTAQLALVGIGDGAARPAGKPAMIAAVDPSPAGNAIVITRIVGPLPHTVPYTEFAREIELWRPDGTLVRAVGHVPIDDRSAMFGVPDGPRAVTWRPDGLSLVYVVNEKTKDPRPSSAGEVPGGRGAVRKENRGTDRLWLLAAPFTGAPTSVGTSALEISGGGFGPAAGNAILFTPSGDRVIVRDADPLARRARAWVLNLGQPGAAPIMLYDRSTEGRYDDPGQPLFEGSRSGHPVLVTSVDGASVYYAGEGASAEGLSPFLDRVSLATGRKQRLMTMNGAGLETFAAALDPGAERLITVKQSASEPPNLYFRERRGGSSRALTTFKDPVPALTSAKRQVVTFKRPDGLELHGLLTLPADYQAGTRLPMICWIYPNDFRNAAAASQTTRTTQRFTMPASLSPEGLVTQGYAIFAPDLAVVGNNDRYVEQVAMSMKAGIDRVVEMGLADPNRIGVGGHSYGAFSTANMLAHSKLFKAGLASDGAYNRTLTPFTFQAEDRTLWEAKDTYLAMSPLLYADRIEAPLLLMHNLADQNVGTDPIQSVRLFQALNGLGKTVELVMYPFEDHGPVARETVLDYWARAIEWFDRYVKGAKTETTQTPSRP